MKNLKIFTNIVEQEAIDQINLLLLQDAFKDCKVRIMPDVHSGKGCVIGFTANLGNKIIPNIVGVDISCGMLTVELGKIDIDFELLDNVIKKFVPSGRNVHDSRQYKFTLLQDLYCYRSLKDTKRIERTIGTLGGGNHFIEIDKDEDDNKYLVIHTGSRNLGKQVAEYYQNLAIDLMSGKGDLFEKRDNIIKTYKELGRKNEIQSEINKLYDEYKANVPNIPKELCYLEGKYREQYLHDMRICNEYAFKNREFIANAILNNMNITPISSFTTSHNYIDLESNIVRKGAISAKKNEKILIPINMKDGCILGIGKGNEDWNQSAPHGAGRLMSRTKAKETLDLNDFKTVMNGIYSSTINESTLDEAPMAYKSLNDIVNNIRDTVEIIKIIKPIYNFKACE